MALDSLLIGLHSRRSACYPYQIKAGFDVVDAAKQRKLPLDHVFSARFTKYTLDMKREYAQLQVILRHCLNRDENSSICDQYLEGASNEAVRGQLSAMHNRNEHYKSVEIAVNALNVFGRMEADKYVADTLPHPNYLMIFHRFQAHTTSGHCRPILYHGDNHAQIKASESPSYAIDER